MAHIHETQTIDGLTPFTFFGGNWDWGSGGWLGVVDIIAGPPPDTYEATLNLAGSNWIIENLRLTGNGSHLDTNLNDAATDALIKLIEIDNEFGGVANIALNDTRVRFIRGGDNDVNLTLGNQRTTAIELYDGDHMINIGTARVTSIETGDGNDTVNGGVGSVDFLKMNGGTNVFNGGTGWLGHYHGGNGADRLTLVGGADSISLGGGNNRLTTGTEFVGQVISYSGNNVVNIGSGGVRSIGFSGGVDNITVNGGFAESIVTGGMRDVVRYVNGGRGNSLDLGDGNNLLVLASTSQVNSVNAYGGDDTVRLGGGQANQINLGSGRNVVLTGAGANLDSLVGYQGDDILTVGAGAFVGQAKLNDGNNRVTLANTARGEQLSTGNGNDVITFNGNSRFDSVRMGEGNNRLTVNTGWVDFVQSHGGNNTVNIAHSAGGIGSIHFTGDNTVHTVNAEGRVGAYQAHHLSRSFVTINDGAGLIQTGDRADIITENGGWIDAINTRGGADQVTINGDGARMIVTGDGGDTVVVNTGWVELINTGNGADFVHLRNDDGAGIVRLGDQNDTVQVDPLLDGRGARLDGGNGVDTADFSNYITSLTIDLSLENGGWQNIAAPGGDLNLVGQGYFQFSRIENLVGSRRADHLTGNDEANHIEGGRGNDTILGGNGEDILEGNEHNDELWGGTDGVTDTFRFRAGDGTDTIKDIEVGIDLIDIIGATQLSDIGFTQSGADVELTFADITIIVENTTVAQLQVDSVFGF